MAIGQYTGPLAPMSFSPSPALVAAESGGNPNAQNPNSTASGLLQITDSMWNGLRKNYPNAGLTNKNDPEQQKKAYSLFMQNEGVPALASAGLEDNDQNRSRLWHWGAPTATALAKADPSAPISSVLGKNAAAIVKANPGQFTDGLATPVGAALSATDALYGNAPVQEIAYDPTPPAPQGMGGPVTIPSPESSDVPLPDAPEHQEVPNTGVAQRVLSYLAGLGAGFGQGRNGAEGAALGTQLGLQNVAALQANARRVEDANADRDQQFYANQLRGQQVNNASQEMQNQRALQMGRLREAGMSAQNILALYNGGQLDDSDLAAMQAASRRANAPQGVVNPTTMVYQDDDGNEHQFITTTRRDTGAPVSYNLDGTPVDARYLATAYPQNSPERKQQALSNRKGLDTAQAALSAGAQVAEKSRSLQTLLPYINAGPSLAAKGSRTLAGMLGMPVGGTDPEMLQMGDTLLAQLKTDTLHASGTGQRLDKPEQDMVMRGVSDFEHSDKAVVNAMAVRNQEVQQYRENMLNAYYDSDPATQRRGYGAFEAKYMSDKATAPKYTPFIDSVRDYRKAQSAYDAEQAQNSPEVPNTSPTAAPSASARVGGAGPGRSARPTTSQGWHLVE